MEENLKQQVVEKIYKQIDENLSTIESGTLTEEEQRFYYDGICKLVDKVVAIESNEYEFLDKKERREIEEKRNETMAQLEKDKQKMDWRRFSLEAGKIVAPIVVVLISASANKQMQENEHKFDGANLIHTGSFWRKFNPFMKM